MELELGMASVLAMLILLAWPRGWRLRVAAAVILMLATYGGLMMGYSYGSGQEELLYRGRNFYGVLYVTQETPRPREGAPPGAPPLTFRLLTHGSTVHGQQFMDPSLRVVPTTYYTATSGAGRAIRLLQKRGPVNIGVVGLGAGTLAAYGRAGDRIVFYEINPAVEKVAREYFTYLGDCRADCRVELGDGRLVLEAQADQHFDLLALDAFSSDSIPLHLLTTQAVDAYLRQLKPDGILAFHITSSYLNLEPVLAELARSRRLAGVLVADGTDSRWVLLSRDAGVLGSLPYAEGMTLLRPRPHQALWTDDYVNIVQVLEPKKRLHLGQQEE
jgi:hypothetical protein